MRLDNSFLSQAVTRVATQFRFHRRDQFGTLFPMSEHRNFSVPLAGPHFVRRVPDGDTHERQVCAQCDYIHYSNPKIVVGSVVTYQNHILLCRRAIEPRKNFWTLPAGFLEERETPEDGARREAKEEACAEITINALLGVYAVPHISQVQLMYRATLAKPEFDAGPESLEVRLFSWDEIPWDLLAFPSVKWALDHWRDADGKDVFAPYTNPIWNPSSR